MVTRENPINVDTSDFNEMISKFNQYLIVSDSYKIKLIHSIK